MVQTVRRQTANAIVIIPVMAAQTASASCAPMAKVVGHARMAARRKALRMTHAVATVKRLRTTLASTVTYLYNAQQGKTVKNAKTGWLLAEKVQTVRRQPADAIAPLQQAPGMEVSTANFHLVILGRMESLAVTVQPRTGSGARLARTPLAHVIAKKDSGVQTAS
jgi:hypothetical protein